MARLCPQCGEIHFDTTTSPMPTHCRRCEADLNEASGLMPRLKEEQETPAGGAPPAQSRPRRKGTLPEGTVRMIVGGVILLAAGVMLFLGYDWNTRAKSATATVAEGNGPKWAQRDRNTATYTAGGKTHHMYPGVRKVGDTFTMYYLPEDPGTGYEQRPFLMLLIGGKVLMVGLGVLALGIFKFAVGRARTVDFERTMARAG